MNRITKNIVTQEERLKVEKISTWEREKIKKTIITFEGYLSEKYPKDFEEWNNTRQKEVIQEPDAIIVEPGKKTSETRHSMSSDQKKMYEKIKRFILKKNSKQIVFPDDTPSGDKEFVLELAKELMLSHIIDENLHQALVLELDSENGEDDEGILAIHHQVLKRYDSMQVLEDWHEDHSGIQQLI